MIESLLAALLALPLPWYDPGTAPETPEERDARVAMIGRVIVDETEEPARQIPWTHAQLASVTATILWHESWRFRYDVHTGERSGDQGDSIGLPQAHRGPWIDGAEWEALAGTDEPATRRAVAYAVKVIAFHLDRCHVHGWSARAASIVIAGYGTGYSCNPELRFAANRGRFADRLHCRIVEPGADAREIAYSP